MSAHDPGKAIDVPKAVFDTAFVSVNIDLLYVEAGQLWNFRARSHSGKPYAFSKECLTDSAAGRVSLDPSRPGAFQLPGAQPGDYLYNLLIHLDADADWPSVEELRVAKKVYGARWSKFLTNAMPETFLVHVRDANERWMSWPSASMEMPEIPEIASPEIHSLLVSWLLNPKPHTPKVFDWENGFYPGGTRVYDITDLRRRMWIEATNGAQSIQVHKRVAILNRFAESQAKHLEEIY